jgi:hypothetical protein
MRAIALAAGVVLATWAAPTASADSVVFVDNPAIIDPHPIAFDSWSRGPDDRTVALHFTTGTPTCYGVHATVDETPATVTVDLQGGTLPEAVGRACILIAVSGTIEVPLQSPLGDRQVLDKHR